MNKTQTFLLYKNLKDSIKLLEKDLEDMFSWEEMYDLGLTVLAIKKYRDTIPNRITLLEAKEMIDSWANNKD